MNITVLFTNQKYRQYLTVYNFICDLKKHKWGELDIHEILWEDNSYDLRHFLYMVTSDKIKTDFFALLDEITFKNVNILLKKLLTAPENRINMVRDTLLEILEDEVFMSYTCEDVDENEQKLDEIGKYLECFYFNRE